jgi:hypothetical protein
VALHAALHQRKDVFVGYRRVLRDQPGASYHGQEQPLNCTRFCPRQVSHFHLHGDEIQPTYNLLFGIVERNRPIGIGANYDGAPNLNWLLELTAARPGRMGARDRPAGMGGDTAATEGCAGHRDPAVECGRR